MPHVVTESCIRCKHTDCVDVCPVDCFREAPLMLVIDPDECIDCALCISECPVQAIKPEEDLLAEERVFIEINAMLSRMSPSITRTHEPLPDAAQWRDVPGKIALLSVNDLDPEEEAKALARVERYRSLADATSLEESVWLEGLEDQDWIVRRMLAGRADLAEVSERLDRLLADPVSAVRSVCLRQSGESLTGEQLGRLLADPDPEIRTEVVTGHGSRLSSAQIEEALRDKDPKVRLAALRAQVAPPTFGQFVRSMTNGTPEERALMSSRMHAELFTPALTHGAPEVRRVAFGWEGVSLTEAQIDAGLRDHDQGVRLAVVSRKDFHLTPAQFARLVLRAYGELFQVLCHKATGECLDTALDCESPEVAARIIATTRFPFTGEHLDRCLASEHESVALAGLARFQGTPTQAQLLVGLASANEAVRTLILNRFGIDRLDGPLLETAATNSSARIRELVLGESTLALKPEQLERGLTDPSYVVRKAVASREDFLPTPNQYERGLADKSKVVRSVFESRFERVDGEIVSKEAEQTIEFASPLEAITRLKIVLKEMSSIPTWTGRKRALSDQMSGLLGKLGYRWFTTNLAGSQLTQTLPLSRVGDHTLLLVPDRQRGTLSAMRGNTVHLVLTGHERYSRVDIAFRSVTPEEEALWRAES